MIKVSPEIQDFDVSFAVEKGGVVLCMWCIRGGKQGRLALRQTGQGKEIEVSRKVWKGQRKESISYLHAKTFKNLVNQTQSKERFEKFYFFNVRGRGRRGTVEKCWWESNNQGECMWADLTMVAQFLITSENNKWKSMGIAGFLHPSSPMQSMDRSKYSTGISGAVITKNTGTLHSSQGWKDLKAVK